MQVALWMWGGVAPTVMENHGTVTAVMIDEKIGSHKKCNS